MDTAMEEELDNFDSVQFCVCDVNTIPRGRVVPRKFTEQTARNGMEMWNGTWLVGPNSELPSSLKAICSTYGSHELRPCLETLTSVPWVSREGHRCGNVLCDVYFPNGSPDTSSPRQLLQVQLNTLREKHGLEVRSGFEYEFFIYKERTMEPLGGNRLHFADLREWDKNHKIFTDLRETLEAVGVDITFLQPEYPPGQWEVSTAPQSGLRGGDVGFHVKHAVKGFFSTRGYLATFMTRPTLESISSGLHLNHSLWKRVGSDKEGSDSNVLLDSSADDKLSDTARHWIAGLATHAPALSAICSPTLNCYRRLHNMCAPSHGTWGHDDRNAMIRARTSRDNVFLENRLVSAAASPYLALAATVAAGMDGLNRLLQCPPPMHKDRAPEVPRTLSEALDALDKDVEMRALLGDYFVDCYVGAKRECEVKAFNDAALTTEAEEMEFERKMYMEAL